MYKNSYTLFFAAIVTLTCSILLSSAATLLKDRQLENIALDQRKNIIVCAGFGAKKGEELARKDILRIYDEKIRSMVLDLEGNFIEDKNISELDPKVDTELLPLYFSEDSGKILTYILPISGKGLWSTIYGYLALESDANTIKGITFYQHGETPGLGGEIEKEWFTENFKGKKIHSPEGSLLSITIVKGKVEEKVAESDRYHYVDGISGSTLTGNGVNNFLKQELQKYEPYFKRINLDKTEQ